MTNEGTLIPIDEQTVDFYGDEITTALVKLDEHLHIYVPLRPICRYLGLSWSGQFERVKRNIFLSGKVRFVRVSRPNQAGDPNVVCLPIELLNGWFFGIASGRVKPEVAFKLLKYQRSCFQVLWDTFQGNIYSIENVPSLPNNEMLSSKPSSLNRTSIEALYRQRIPTYS